MIAEQNIAAEPRRTLSMQPRKFALWLFIVSIVMLFAALTSAYIVKQADGNWLAINMPPVFMLSTAIIAFSSLTMHLAYLAAKKDEIGRLKLMLAITVFLGIGFLMTQYYSWAQLVASNVYFVSNYVSGSFIYVFTGLHGAHIVTGIVYLLITLTYAFMDKVHSKRLLQIEMCMTFWHFLGGLWLYLYLFLLLNS
ncbi:MAG: cytochrome c oxidase subunit 3 [Cyclobacteriaceae bacterium]|nr:cytochrome c oxidase subunit 3 [Cyclobacteriaceae bacterium]